MRVENTFLGAEQVGERTEQRLWEQGATRWEAFDRSYRGIGSTRAERIEQYIDGGRDALADGDVDFFHERFPTRDRWRLYESFRERTCFLTSRQLASTPIPASSRRSHSTRTARHRRLFAVTI